MKKGHLLEPETAAGGQPAGADTPLFSLAFVSLNLAVFFGFCNLAMFYGFYGYLGKIGIAAEWRGFLLGLEPLAAFVLRLLVIPVLHAGSAFRVMLLSLFLIIGALCSYPFALNVPALIAVRILHGAAFVLLVSSATVLLTGLIPKARSAEAFAIMSVAWLVPYAVMPALFDFTRRFVSNEAHIYALATILAVPGIALLAATKTRIQKAVARSDASATPPARECLKALRQPGMRVLLAVSFSLFFANTSVFFFMKSLIAKLGYGDAGPFFTISTSFVILSRIFGGRLLDRLSKWRMLLVFAPPLAACLVLFHRVHGIISLWALAGVFGLCLGVLFPVVNAAVFLSSPPHLRGANANVLQSVMDVAYFVSPPVAGALLARGYGPGALFDLCAVLVAAGLGALLLFRWRAAPAARSTLVFDAAQESVA